MEILKEVMMTEGLALEDLSEVLEDITKKWLSRPIKTESMLNSNY